LLPIDRAQWALSTLNEDMHLPLENLVIMTTYNIDFLYGDSTTIDTIQGHHPNPSLLPVQVNDSQVGLYRNIVLM
jgi:hypothetical protein